MLLGFLRFETVRNRQKLPPDLHEGVFENNEIQKQIIYYKVL